MIDRFWGKHRFLSNFYPAPVWLDNELYPTVEHAYQAAKTLDPQIRAMIRVCPTPGEAKKIGSLVTLRTDWSQRRLSTMEKLLEQKFRQPELKRRLLSTGHEELIEGNTWGDTFWGVYQGKGENHLGKLLMKLRHRIREDRREI